MNYLCFQRNRSRLCISSIWFHGYSSCSSSFFSGVPILDPVVFLFVIIPSFLFSCRGPPLDCALLQSNLNTLVGWCSVNKRIPNINISRCPSMCNWLKFSPTTLDGQLLSHASLWAYQNLGVSLDDKLHFNSYFVDIINRPFKISGFILHSFNPACWVSLLKLWLPRSWSCTAQIHTIPLFIETAFSVQTPDMCSLFKPCNCLMDGYYFPHCLP